MPIIMRQGAGRGNFLLEAVAAAIGAALPTLSARVEED